MLNVVQEIARFNRGRDSERLKLKYLHMRQGAFLFLRGSAHLFDERLPSGKLFDKAPLAWLCGDLHLENFGSYKGDNRLVYFDINDFDDAALGPFTWDLLRLLTSVLVAAGDLHVSDVEAQDLCMALLDSYAGELVLGKARWVERDTSQGLVRALLDALRERKRADFLNRRTELVGKRRRLLLDGKRALAVSDEQRERVTAWVGEFAASQADADFYKVLDVARRVAGTGSLGVERYVVLVKGKGSPDANYLLDIKQARPSPVAARSKAQQPAWASEAHRVVALQQRMQAVAMAFLQPLKVGKRSYVLRALQPTEDRLVLDRSKQTLDDFRGVMRTLGELLAWAQLRSSGRQGAAPADELMDFAAGRKWRKEIMAAAQVCAAQVVADWKVYATAYDDGAFARVAHQRDGA